MKKYKNWTALLAVKIFCFILVLICGFCVLDRTYAVVHREQTSGVFANVVFVNLDTPRYFFERTMHITYDEALRALYYGSEEAISAGDYLRWSVEATGRNLTSLDGSHHYGWVQYDSASYYTDISSEARFRAEQNAIREQLDEFRRTMEYLNSERESGLIYRLSDSKGVVEGSIQASREWFKGRPVWVIQEGTAIPSSTFRDREYFHYYDRYTYDSPVAESRQIFLAYDESAVAARNVVYREMQDAYIDDFVEIGVFLILAVAAIVLLMLGAGRRYKDAETVGAPLAAPVDIKGIKRKVHFNVIDKPFLDITLAITAAWVVLALLLTIYLFEEFYRYDNRDAIRILTAAAPVIALPPALLWLMSLSKRVKAGGFWRHTLIYFIPSRLYRLCKRLGKSLWAGLRLTWKVAVISAAALAMLIFTAAVVTLELTFAIIFALLFTAIVAFFLLRYARRIHKLDIAVKAVSEGNYETEISVGGGELGSIAQSVMNISSGMNKAVEERMKSERLRTELITNVSHDIRTPLTSIITYTDLLKSEGTDSEKASEYLDVLTQKTQRLKTLTDELFEASKAATGNIEVNLADINIVSLINQVLGELDSAVNASGLDMRVSLPDHLIVKADGRLMWRVLDNLLSNVFNYSLPSSRVYIQANASEGTGTAQISIKNISATELNVDPSELIERFKRGDESRGDGGSGLGLSIVQSFVEAQGGTFTISIDGDLFKATVCLPLVQAQHHG